MNSIQFYASRIKTIITRKKKCKSWTPQKREKRRRRRSVSKMINENPTTLPRPKKENRSLEYHSRSLKRSKLINVQTHYTNEKLKNKTQKNKGYLWRSYEFEWNCVLSLCLTEFCCCGLWLRVRYPPSCLKNKGWRCNANEIQVKWPQMQFHEIMTVAFEYLIWRTPSRVTFVVQTAGSLLSVALWGRINHYPSLQIALPSLLFLTKVIFGIPVYQMHSSSCPPPF